METRRDQKMINRRTKSVKPYDREKWILEQRRQAEQKYGFIFSKRTPPAYSNDERTSERTSVRSSIWKLKEKLAQNTKKQKTA
jgi:hypothetical protein